MKAEELAVIKERAEKATSGPWESDCYGIGVAPYGIDSDLCHAFDERDAEFIANAREDVPRLVAEVERLRSVIWRISDYCDMSVEETRAYLDGDDDE